MSKPRRPHDELKPLITDIAERIVASEGPSGLNARRLAKEAACSVGTLYNLFGHLDGIVRSVNLSSMAMLADALEASQRPDYETAEQRLIALADAYFDFAFQNPHRWEALFHYRSETPNEGLIGAAKGKLFTILQTAAKGFEDVDALLALWAAVHGVVELALTRRLSGVDAPREQQYARLIVMAGLRGIGVLREEGVI